MRLLALLVVLAFWLPVTGCDPPPERSTLERLDPPFPWEVHEKACPQEQRRCMEVSLQGSGAPFPETLFALIDCKEKTGNLVYGSWSLGSGDVTDFAWEGLARQGGVLPLGDHTLLIVQCNETHPRMHDPRLEYAIDPDGFQRVALEHGNVLIPFRGKATLANRFEAWATLAEMTDGGPPAHVTITVQCPGTSPSVYPNLGVGDTFDWADREAQVARFVGQEASVFGTIGWVEIALAPVPPATASAGATWPAAPDAGPRSPPKGPPRPAGSRSSAN